MAAMSSGPFLPDLPDLTPVRDVEAADLNLCIVPLALEDRARQAFAHRDPAGFVSIVPNAAALRLVFDNLMPLRAAGMYEQALLEALTGTEANHTRWALSVLRFMCEQADPARLRAAGDPLPSPGPF